MEDDLTKALKTICKNFLKHLGKESVADRAMDAFLPLIREELVDPITLGQLGEEPLLGSDGYPYSRASLSVYFSGVPEKFRTRSPLAPQSETPFTTRPHPVAKLFIEWLKKHKEYKPPEEERQYREMALAGALPTIPSSVVDERAARIQRLLATRAAVEREEEKESPVPAAADLDAEAEQIVTRTFAPLHARIEATAERNIARVEANTARFNDQLAQAAQEVQRLKREEEAFRRRVEELSERLDSAEDSLTTAQRETCDLERDINEAQRELAERNGNWLGALCQAALIIGGSIGVSWALATALKQAGMVGVSAGAKASGDSILGSLSFGF